MVDRVRPLKLEGPAAGTETDPFPTALEANEDFVEARGLAIQNNASADEKVLISRDAGDNLTFKDGVVSGAKTLSDLLPGVGAGLTAAQHQVLRQAIHFLDEGPGGGFASGAFKEVAGGLFPTRITWWESSSKLKRIVELLIERSAGPATVIKPTPITLRVYATDGVSIVQTIRDDISYSGIAEVDRTRTIT